MSSSFNSASNYSGAFREELARRTKSDQPFRQSWQDDFGYRAAAAKDAGKDWEQAERFLSDFSKTYMQIATQKREKKERDAIGIAREEVMSEKEIEQYENQLRSLRSRKDQSEKVKQEIESTLESMKVALHKQRQILNEVDNYSKGEDRDIIESARAKIYFSPGGGADEALRTRIDTEISRLRKIHGPNYVLNSGERQVLINNFTNETILDRWGNDPSGSGWRKANIYPHANKWEERYQTKEIKTENARHGEETRQVAMLDMGKKDFNINRYLNTVAHSTAADGENIYGFPNAHKLFLQDAQRNIDAGLINYKDIERWGDQNLPGLKMKFKDHPTYNKLIELEQANRIADEELATRAAKKRLNDDLDGITETLIKGLEQGNNYTREFIQKEYEALEEANPDASSGDLLAARNKLESFEYDQDKIRLEYEQTFELLKKGELTKEDVGKLSIYNKDHFEKLLESYGDKEIHKNELNGLQSTVTNVARDLASNSRLENKAFTIVGELHKAYLDEYFTALNEDPDITLSEAKARGVTAAEKLFEKHGGPKKSDKINGRYYYNGYDYPNLDLGTSERLDANTKRLNNLNTNIREEMQPVGVNYTDGTGAKIPASNVDPNYTVVQDQAKARVLNTAYSVWKPQDLQKVVLDYNRGEGILGGYISNNTKALARLLGVDPYKLIETQANLAKEEPRKDSDGKDITIPKLEERKNYPDSLKDLEESLNPSQKEILYGNK